MKLRASSDIQIETVLTEKMNKKRIIIGIETDEVMPVNKGKVIFEVDSEIHLTSARCKNSVIELVKRINGD